MDIGGRGREDGEGRKRTMWQDQHLVLLLMGGVPESFDDCRSANDFVFHLSSSWQSTAWSTQSEEVNSWLTEVSLTTNGPLSPLDMCTNHHTSYRLDTGEPGGIECSMQFKGLLYQIWSCGLIHVSTISLLRFAQIVTKKHLLFC
jgi:hypothetical protein